MAPRAGRLERITNLVLVLLETERPLSLREIGATVAGYPSQPGALRQAFERDKRTLRDEGVPIAVERLDGEDQVGYRILADQYYLPDPGLDPDEEEALAFAVAAVRLESGIGAGVGQKFARAPGGLAPVVVLPSLPALGVLHEAVRRRAVAHFTYHGRRRAVEGLGLLFRNGGWYLVGVDEAAGAKRTFRVDRIEDTPALGEPASYEVEEGFDPASEVSLAPFLGGEGATEVVIDVDVREVGALVSIVGRAAVEERRRDGSARLRFSVGDETAFVGFVLGFGDAVEVLGPEPLRRAVIAALEAAASEAAASEAAASEAGTGHG